MGCNTSQEQPQSTAKGNADADVQDESKCNNESQPQDTHENTEKKAIDEDKKHNLTVNSTNIAASENSKNSNCLVSSKNDGTNHATDANSACDDEEDESKAAVKIQAVFRGHKVRATMKKAEQPSSTQKGNECAKQEPERAVTPSKAELEAEFDPNDQELCHAATRIQAAFRGHLHRRIAGGEQQEDVDMNEITKKVAEELDIDLTDPELNKAATKIQASFRGHKIRKDIGTVNQ